MLIKMQFMGRNSKLRVLTGLFGLIALLFAVYTPALAAGAFQAPVQVVAGFNSPTTMQFSSDGRLFISTEPGQILVVQAGVAQPYFTIPPATIDANVALERGLLGFTFDPAFNGTGFLYLYYTHENGAPVSNNRVSRYPVTNNVVGAEQVLLNLPALTNNGNNGGAMSFGPDGKLYVAVGDNYVAGAAQNTANQLGKMLRLNADGTFPGDNPFANGIWAYGLRNPFTFAFQPGTNRLFINDVGNNGPEEINEGFIGTDFTGPYNYAWDGVTQGPTANPLDADPIFNYAHGPGFTNCAILGGTFYNNTGYQYPAEFVGDYFYGDYCSGYINHFDAAGRPVNPIQFLPDGTAVGLIDLKVSPNGELYYMTRDFGTNDGIIFRVPYLGSPEIIQPPANTTIAYGQSATFTCQATGTAPLSYGWTVTKNGQTLAAAASQVGLTSFTVSSLAGDLEGATVTCTVSNGVAPDVSAAATLTVTGTPVVQPPSVVAPSTGTGQAGISVFDPGLSKIGELLAGSIGLPGERITWTTTVTNNGGTTGTNVIVVDEVRSGLRIEDTNTDRGTISISGQTVTVTIPTLAAGESIRFRIITTVVVTPLDGIITNTVTIPGTNKSATATLNVATIFRLPSTGETPLWRSYAVTIAMIIAVGMVALMAVSLIQVVAMPRRPRRPESKYTYLR